MTDIPSDLLSAIEQARAGNRSAQGHLIRTYQERMAGFVFAFTGQPGTVEDLTQTIFLKMILKLHHLSEPAKFEAWLFRLAGNTCRDHFRREKWRRLFQPFAPEHEEQPAPPSGDSESLLAALQKLPPAQRELLILLQEQEWSYEELASITRSTVSSVKSRLFRARQELKRLLHDE